MADSKDTSRASGTGRVLEERLRGVVARLEDQIKALMGRIESVEERQESQQANYTQILVELRVLQTKVGLLAAGIGSASGIATVIVTTALKGALGL